MSPTTLQTLREKIALNIAPDGIMWVDSSGRILLVNPAMERLSGYSAHELVGQSMEIFLPTQLRNRHKRHIGEYFHSPRVRAMGLIDISLLRRDGTHLPVDISLGYWEEDGDRFAVAYIRDLTERKAYEETLRHQATHDEVTKLPNRWLFMLQLKQAIAQAKRHRRLVGVMLLDLDDFKMVNDSFGHSLGDELLVQVGRCLREALRENDILARIGGDEFVFLLPELETEDEALAVVRRLQLALEKPFLVQGQKIHMSGSFGLAFFPRDAEDGETLLRFADMAMYQAKHTGRATYACYSQEMDRRAQEEMTILSRLKEALKLGKLKLFFQPQIDMQSRAIVGAEALLRWRDDELGEVPPGKFVAIAEKSGLIQPLSDWVLETACKQIAQWEAVGMPLRVAVNVSAQLFRRANLVSEVNAMLQQTGASGHLLEIEITETAVMASPESAREQINGLVDLGCSVTLDDFGTGYSSLTNLKAMPVSQLKIDRDFVNGILHDEDDCRITRSVIALARTFGMKVVAEGVENGEQEQLLRELGCDFWQGWLFSKAIAPEELSAMLAQQLRKLPSGEFEKMITLKAGSAATKMKNPGGNCEDSFT